MNKKTGASPKRPNRKEPSWAAKISEVADIVVEMFSEALPKGSKLDFSEKSIQALDKVIKRVWGVDGPSEENRHEMNWAIGCYVAEVLQRNYEGIWTNSSDGYSFDCSKSGVCVSPWNWVAKRFEFGMSEALAPKYQFAQTVLAKDRKSIRCV